MPRRPEQLIDLRGARAAQLVVSEYTRKTIIPLATVSYVQAIGHCSAIHHAGGMVISTHSRHTLVQLARRYDNLKRVSRSILVQPAAVIGLEKVPAGKLYLVKRDLVLSTGERLRISRRHYRDWSMFFAAAG